MKRMLLLPLALACDARRRGSRRCGHEDSPDREKRLHAQLDDHQRRRQRDLEERRHRQPPGRRERRIVRVAGAEAGRVVLAGLPEERQGQLPRLALHEPQGHRDRERAAGERDAPGRCDHPRLRRQHDHLGRRDEPAHERAGDAHVAAVRQGHAVDRDARRRRRTARSRSACRRRSRRRTRRTGARRTARPCRSTSPRASGSARAAGSTSRRSRRTSTYAGHYVWVQRKAPYGSFRNVKRIYLGANSRAVFRVTIPKGRSILRLVLPAAQAGARLRPGRQPPDRRQARLARAAREARASYDARASAYLRATSSQLTTFHQASR